MASKKDMLKGKLKKTAPAVADQLFNNTGTTEVKAEVVKPAKVTPLKAKAVKEVVHRKETRVKEEYARVNLFMPPELKEKAEILANDKVQGAGNLSKLINELVQNYVDAKADRLSVLMGEQIMEIDGIKVYTLAEVAKKLQLTERTLHTYIKQKKIKAVKIGGRWHISEENLKNFLNGWQVKIFYFHKDTLTEVEKYVRYVSQKRVKNVFGRKRKNEYEDED